MRLLKKEKYNKILLKGGFLSSNDEEEVEVIVPPRRAHNKPLEGGAGWRVQFARAYVTYQIRKYNLMY